MTDINYEKLAKKTFVALDDLLQWCNCALEDPKCCDEFKDVIRKSLNTAHEMRGRLYEHTDRR